MKTLTATTLLALATACSETKPVRKRLPYQALLGVRSDSVLAHIRANCRTDPQDKPLEADVGIYCDGYSVSFDPRGRIREVKIDATGTEAVKTFDRAIAPIVPDDIREGMRRSITDPADFRFMKPGGFVWRAQYPYFIIWDLNDYCAGEFVDDCPSTTVIDVSDWKKLGY